MMTTATKTTPCLVAIEQQQFVFLRFSASLLKLSKTEQKNTNIEQQKANYSDN